MHFSAKLFHSNLMKGTIILTAASFFTKVLGFVYRIYIAQFFHEEGMGLIQLSFPIVVLFFSICAAGTQTAISRFTASSHHNIIYFCAGSLLGFGVSIGCALFLYAKADWIAISFLKDARCAPLLRIHALSLPLSTLHACFNGYFIGLEKASYPAISQILEQITRVGFVYLFIRFALSKNLPITLAVAVLGSFIGEVVSTVFSAIVFLTQISLFPLRPGVLSHFADNLHHNSLQLAKANRQILSLAVPITFHRILINCLSSLEATLIPQQLIVFGLSKTLALSLYGVLTGMALPASVK